MKLFKLTDLNSNYDEISEVLVRAESEEAARVLVAGDGGGERPERFLNSIHTTCEEITVDGPMEIIIEYVTGW